MPEATPDEKNILRQKMIGVKIQHARIRAGVGIKEAAKALGVSVDFVSEVEYGRRDPSLPQLEVMAILYKVPVVYFWSEAPIEEIDWNFPTLEAMALRRRIIGVLLRQARAEAGRSHEDLAQRLDVSTDYIVDYEYGRREIPLHQLETLAADLKVSLDYFLDQGISPAKANGHATDLDQIAQFSKLPPDVREFLLNPANLLYLNIAIRLSNLSAETLRGLAEGLLEVTY